MANPITQVEVGETIYDVRDAGAVRSINGNPPDEEGNVQVQTGGGGGTVVLATIGTSWTENDDGTKSQTVAVDGVTAENHVQVGPYFDSANYSRADYVEQKNQFLEYVTNGDGETVDGGITFNIYADANTVVIPIFVEVL